MAATAPEPSVIAESFGRRLRRERERRQIAIASIAENSKISASLFEDLERDNASRWPSGIFRRAFIRAYAQGIGVDPESTTREFLERFPDPNEPLPAADAPPASSKSTLRLTLADTGTSFVGGRLLRAAGSRWTAVACDGLIVATLALVIYVVVGTVWLPLSVAMAGYYVGGILLLGNTPGVCLCAPGGRERSPRVPARPEDEGPVERFAWSDRFVT